MALAIMRVGVSSLSSLPLPSSLHLLPSIRRCSTLQWANADARRFRKSAARSSPDDNDPKASRFMDEDGVVDDMTGYLNHLSLEYDSVWDTKPSWCQPWTITLTGVLVTAASWLVLRSAPVTVVVLFIICAWWYIFLYSYPKAYTEMIAERRRNVKNGMEDTFGL